MESSSVYMCFPCYQEFNTLEEVLQHQLTCTAEEDHSASAGAAAASVPVLQMQHSELSISKTDAVQQAKVQQIAQVDVAQIAAEQAEDPQIEVHEGLPTLQQIKRELDEAPDPEKDQTDQPRILYQCGECEELFRNLNLWHQHRKEGACQQTASAHNSVSDSHVEPEAEPPAESQFSMLEQEEMSEFDATRNLKAELEENSLDPAPNELTQTSSPQSSDVVVPVALVSSANADDLSPRRRGANKKPKPEPVLLCVDCGSCFGLVSELVAHRKTQHGFGEALHRCYVCGESFLNTTLFLYHRKQHRQKGEESVVVIPEVTPEEVYTLNNGANLQEDAQTSTFTQPEVFLCTHCGQTFSDGKGLAAHRKNKHVMEEPLHTCSHCGEDFMNTTLFLYHWRQHRLDSMKQVADGIEISAEASTVRCEDVAQGTKRLLSPSAAESGSPIPKKGRPSLRILSANALQGSKTLIYKEELGENIAGDSSNANQPPPAKLLQDWARTPLPHVCPYCGKTFTRRVFLRTHVYSHTGEKLFTCKVCTKSFTNSQSLLRHTMSHTGNKPYCCDCCGKSFSQAATLKRHQRIHTSTEPPRKRGRKPVCDVDSEGAAHLFACPNCPSRFSTEDQLNHHKLLHTSHPFPCPDCGEPFKRRKDLDLHSLIHQDKQPVTCPHCSSQFINQTVLDIHLQRCPVPEEERNTGRGRGQGRGRSTGQMECDLCGHRCMTQEGLDLHRLSHTGQTPLKCPVRPCRRRFTSNSALEEHVLAHFQGTLPKSKVRPRFRCDICLKEFAYNSTFSVHMRTHTDERPFECTTCGKRFRQLPHLQDHERIHTGVRPFCCWICGKSFSVAARLTEHARTHSGEKPYPCPHCTAAFRSRPNLDKHLRQHGDIPMESVEEVAQAAEVAQVQKVLEGAKALSSLATTADCDSGTVQTIYVLQGGEDGTETVMIPSDQLAGIEGASQVVILPSSMLGAQTIAVPSIALDENELTMVETGQSPQHTIEFIVEETV